MPPCVVCKVRDLQHNDDNDNVQTFALLVAQRAEKVQGKSTETGAGARIVRKIQSGLE